MARLLGHRFFLLRFVVPSPKMMVVVFPRLLGLTLHFLTLKPIGHLSDQLFRDSIYSVRKMVVVALLLLASLGSTGIGGLGRPRAVALVPDEIQSVNTERRVRRAARDQGRPAAQTSPSHTGSKLSLRQRFLLGKWLGLCDLNDWWLYRVSKGPSQNKKKVSWGRPVVESGAVVMRTAMKRSCRVALGQATETDLGILMRMGMNNVPFVGKLGGVLETSSSLLRAERMGSPWALRAGVGDILAGTVLLSGLGSSG